MKTAKASNSTTHASVRMQQRGVSTDMLVLHERYADVECFVGNGRISRTLTDVAASEMKRIGVSQQNVEKVRKMAVLYTRNDNLVTVLFVRAGHGKTYRQGARKRYQGKFRSR
jgi:hypothetical protein